MSRMVLWTPLLLIGTFVGAQAEEQQPAFHTVWQVGQADDNTAEFALAPTDYRAYRQPGFFVVGRSDAKRDWPYVQPGTVDGGWAPGTPQTFNIVFALADTPQQSCRLTLDLVDTHSAAPPVLRVQVNDFEHEYQTPQGAGDASVYGDPGKGRQHLLAVDIPAANLKAGENRVGITTVSGSWVLWDAVIFEAREPLTIAPVTSQTFVMNVDQSPALLHRDDSVVQPLSLTICHTGPVTQATVHMATMAALPIELQPGIHQVTAYVPPVDQSQDVSVQVEADGRTLASNSVRVDPIRRWEIHLVHQTHLDIGYTHTQEDVLRLQVDHLYKALDYIDASRAYPEDAQFKWHPEGMWAVEEFLRVANEEDKKRFIDACRQGKIHLDVLYAQAMSGMYTEEELIELMSAAKRFEQQFGVQISSAMQSDVPGYTWGLATALAHNDVHFMSVGPNGGHRIGHTYTWGDRPFWWVSPSGKQKVLFYMCGGGYYGLQNAEENAIFAAVQRLEKKDYPYDLAMIRVLSGGDNAPPNPNLADQVLAWNKKYASPKLVISTNSAFLQTFAERYGSEIPVEAGDFTPYWEDGAASTAKATGVNREACERIAQAQILWSMLRPDETLHTGFDTAWNKLIMYDEHTWGAHNSISRPDDPFAVQQDAFKQAYAFDGAALTDKLVNKVTAPVTTSTIDVHNPASWSRTELVRLTANQSKAGDQVQDDQGHTVPAQRLATGELAFLATDVPAFGTRRFTIRSGSANTKGSVRVAGSIISNNLLTLQVDPQTGAIQSLRRTGCEGDWVDSSADAGLNSYLYIIGRNPEEGRAQVTGPVSVVVEDAGPLVGTLRIESEAPGCERLTRRIQLIDGADHIEIVNTTYKLKERRPEGLYFGFPFNLPDATARVDVPWAVVEVDRDQLPGANRNFYCVQRWVDLSNENRGVTWVTLDAPMIQFDPIKIATTGGTQTWRTQIDPPPVIWSWTMNNHWETNYKADQEGEVTFRFALRPHDGYDPVAAQRFGRRVCQPLLAAGVDPAVPVNKPLVTLEGDEGVLITQIRPSRNGHAYMVRLFNVADNPQQVRLAWNRPVGKTWVSNPMEQVLDEAPALLELDKFEVLTVKVERKE